MGTMVAPARARLAPAPDAAAREPSPPRSASKAADLFHVGAVAKPKVTWTDASAPPKVGAAPLDAVALTEAAALRHLAPALGRGDLSIGELFDECNLDFKQSPDPTSALRAAHAENAARTVPEGATDVSLTTYNVALLDATVTIRDLPLLGWLPKWPFDKIVLRKVQAPLLEARKKKIPELIFAKGDDVIMLQEVWRQQDVDFLTAEASKRGYRAVSSPRDEYSDGLLTLVKDSSIAPASQVAVSGKPYEAQQWKESLAGVKRGYHAVRFVHPKAGPMTVFNTHMQAYADQWPLRNAQAREIGLAARAMTDADPSGVVVLGGDLNAGPYYAEDVWDKGEGRSEQWWRNAVAYGLVEHYSGLGDAAVMGQDSARADDDVELAKNAMPAGDAPIWPFTASARSNGLYDNQYGHSEPRARLDHIRVGAANGRVKVTGAEMDFTDEVDVGGQTIEPSDHYGVRVKLKIA